MNFQNTQTAHQAASNHSRPSAPKTAFNGRRTAIFTAAAALSFATALAVPRVSAAENAAAAASPASEFTTAEPLFIAANPPPAASLAPTDEQSETTRLSSVRVAAPKTGETPLSVILDTNAAARPSPAQDGADILRSIPGIFISRKGGTGGEIYLRGAGGSRLSVLLDHESLLGGCPGRMDPPSAYIFPSDFESVTVLKGPSAVRHGPGNSAGVVLFKTAVPNFETQNVHADISAGFGSAQRSDQNLAFAVGTESFYLKTEATRTEADNYRDGDGSLVHSEYRRRGGRFAAGWTPDKNTVLEAHASLAEGRAAYAHSMMDASTLDRREAGLRFEKKQITNLLHAVEAGLFYNSSDHVMDDFSLRTPSGMSMGASNVSQTLIGGRALATLAVRNDKTFVTPGIDFLFSEHDQRSGTQANSYKNNARKQDSSIGTVGAFVELSHAFDVRKKLQAGARLNSWFAKDHRDPLRTVTDSGGGMSGHDMGHGSQTTTTTGKATGGKSRDELLPALFARYEHEFAALKGVSFYANIGHTWRAPDYWELFSYQSSANNSSFDTKPEKTTQLDIGGEWKRDLSNGTFAIRTALFANRTDDYILVHKVTTHDHVTHTNTTRTLARNVDATVLGGEISASYTLNVGAGQLQLDGSLAYAYGRNNTDTSPLAQLPPFEALFAIGYTVNGWSFGATARLIAAQHRYAKDQGGITGLDLGHTGGFAVFGLNAGYRISEKLELSVGVDNLLNETYAEHVSRPGSGYPGFDAHSRVREPGRSFWGRLRLRY